MTIWKEFFRVISNKHWEDNFGYIYVGTKTTAFLWISAFAIVPSLVFFLIIIKSHFQNPYHKQFCKNINPQYKCITQCYIMHNVS